MVKVFKVGSVLCAILTLVLVGLGVWGTISAPTRFEKGRVRVTEDDKSITTRTYKDKVSSGAPDWSFQCLIGGFVGLGLTVACAELEKKVAKKQS